MDYKVALVQGIYFLITGIWPLLSMKTFLLITGPKTDLWLVKTFGLILAVIGAVLLYAQMTGKIKQICLSSCWQLEVPLHLHLSRSFM